MGQCLSSLKCEYSQNRVHIIIKKDPTIKAICAFCRQKAQYIFTNRQLKPSTFYVCQLHLEDKLSSGTENPPESSPKGSQS